MGRLEAKKETFKLSIDNLKAAAVSGVKKMGRIPMIGRIVASKGVLRIIEEVSDRLGLSLGFKKLF